VGGGHYGPQLGVVGLGLLERKLALLAMSAPTKVRPSVVWLGARVLAVRVAEA
jgi:hypothetical protein